MSPTHLKHLSYYFQNVVVKLRTKMNRMLSLWRAAGAYGLCCTHWCYYWNRHHAIYNTCKIITTNDYEIVPIRTAINTFLNTETRPTFPTLAPHDVENFRFSF